MLGAFKPEKFSVVEILEYGTALGVRAVTDHGVPPALHGSFNFQLHVNKATERPDTSYSSGCTEVCSESNRLLNIRRSAVAIRELQKSLDVSRRLLLFQKKQTRPVAGLIFLGKGFDGASFADSGHFLASGYA